MNSPLATSRARIAEFEAFHNLRLPEDYIDFLMAPSGSQQKFLSTIKGERVIERFLPLLDDPRSDARGIYDIAVVVSELEARLTDEGHQEDIVLVPVAQMSAGDLIVLDYRRNSDAPEVAMWDQEASEEFAPVTYPICESFSGLLKLLREGPG